MKLLSRKAIEILFTTTCISVTIFMVGYWIYKYHVEDRDIAIVEHLSLSSIKAKDMIPLPTVCFKDPFIDHKLKEAHLFLNTTHNLVDGKNYLEYLKGNYYDPVYENIEYNNVTLDLNKYFLYATQKLINETSSTNISTPIDHINSFNGFYSGQFIKCYTIDFSLNGIWQIKRLQFRYDTQKLRDDWQPIGSQMKFYTKIHLKDQFLVGGFPDFGILSTNSIAITSTNKDVYIKGYEVLNKRNSRNRQCSKFSESYGTMILDEHLERKSCRPPYIKQNMSIELCSNKEKIKESKFNYEAPDEMKIDNPCQRVSQTMLDMKSTKKRGQDKWTLSIYYPKEFKIIEQFKEVDIHSLIGNIGGYLGLFMGIYLLYI